MAEKTGQIFDYTLLKKLLRLARPYKFWFIAATFIAIFSAVLSPIRPYYIGIAIDEYIGIKGGQGLNQLILILFLLLVLESVVRYFFIYFTSNLGQTVIRNLRLDVFKKITGFSLRYFDTTPIGTSTTRTISDVETINDLYSENFFTIISDILTIIIILAIMFYKNWQLALVSISPFPLLLWATYVFKENVKKAFTKIREKISEMNAFLQEHISGVKITQIFNAEEKEFEKFKHINKEQTDAQIASIWHYSVYFPVVDMILSISIGLMVCYAAYQILGYDQIKAGEITSFFLYLNMLFRPMRFLADKFNTLQMGIVASERVFKLLESNFDTPNEGKVGASHFKGHIEFKNVSFEYTENTPVLQNISFDVSPGQSLAIVGKTGSGKTSIISALNRFYEIKSGEICIDGIPIQHYSLEALRQNIGMVLQDVFLFSGSIFENISLYNPNISREQIIAAAKELELHEFIMALPGNYDYNVMERGATLSLGQRQIISFIRVLVTNPSILILDEATSSIDSNSEKIIQKAIEKLIKGRTTIAIAHRLSTILHADKIIVLDTGKINGIGNHATLLQSNKIYQQYFSDKM
jgi:ATP-binding cassette subfamily B multidrug efflux pump